ncbi:MAG: hypothetical protein DRJ45_07160 [Thermoprotei archaeon]|nr:MAG: hypothetical protein DRJ45_07160 [Thermoprotei archaeon]
MTTSCWQPILHYHDPYALLFHFTRLFTEYMMWTESPHHELVYPCIGELSAVTACLQLLENTKVKGIVNKFRSVWEKHIYEKKYDQKTLKELQTAGRNVIQKLVEMLSTCKNELALTVVPPVTGEKK